MVSVASVTQGTLFTGESSETLELSAKFDRPADLNFSSLMESVEIVDQPDELLSGIHNGESYEVAQVIESTITGAMIGTGGFPDPTDVLTIPLGALGGLAVGGYLWMMNQGGDGAAGNDDFDRRAHEADRRPAERHRVSEDITADIEWPPEGELPTRGEVEAAEARQRAERAAEGL